MRGRDPSATLRVMPRHKETDVPRDTTLLVAASRPVANVASGCVRIRSDDDRDIEGILNVSGDGRVLFWRPRAALEANAEHRIRISGVRDLQGGLFEEVESSFVTGHFSYPDLDLAWD